MLSVIGVHALSIIGDFKIDDIWKIQQNSNNHQIINLAKVSHYTVF